MTNLQIIALAYAQFAENKLDDCEKTLSRIRKLFEIDHDEYRFEIVAEITQPLKETAEKLIEAGQPELVGDENYRATEAYLKKEIKTLIRFKSVDPYAVERVEEDDEDGIEFYFAGHYRFDAKGIAASALTGGQHTKHLRNEVKLIIEEWLYGEFGSIKNW